MTAETAEEVVPAVPGGPPAEDDGPSEEAPYGWMKDPATGERRPKLRPGKRPKGAVPPVGKSPGLQELQELGSLPEAAEDVAPGAPKRGRRVKKPAPALPPFRAGVISNGVNQLYRRAGRLIRVMHYDIGTAVIATTKASDEESVTVGEAWENLAKTNPRIRAFLLKLMQGGAMTDLFMAHLPIFMAIVMLEGVRERLPILNLAGAVLTDEDDDGTEMPSGMAQMMGGINPQDMEQMMAMAQNMMGSVAAQMNHNPNTTPREPTVEQG